MSHILDPLQQLEPSLVRILVSLPWDAAQRLRQLANDGNPELRALNIQSVQFEGDSVITLKAGGEDIKITKCEFIAISCPAGVQTNPIIIPSRR